MKAIDITGERSGRLLVLRYTETKNKKRMVECRCDCGTIVVIAANSISTGNSKSCGCYYRESRGATYLKHGATSGKKFTPEYAAWQNIRSRCYNPRANYFSHYGGRGITMAPEWKESFAAFLADVGYRPSSEHSIDRHPNNDGNYEPGNVRWATKNQQARNKRSNKIVEFRGQKITVVELFEVTGGGDRARYYRIKDRLSRGWGVERAVCTP